MAGGKGKRKAGQNRSGNLAFYISKGPPLRDFTTAVGVPKTKTAQNGHRRPGLTGGLVPSGTRPPKESNPPYHAPSSRTVKTGHFYLR